MAFTFYAREHQDGRTPAFPTEGDGARWRHSVHESSTDVSMRLPVPEKGEGREAGVCFTSWRLRETPSCRGSLKRRLRNSDSRVWFISSPTSAGYKPIQTEQLTLHP
ncbi:Hypothetical predicted protein [Pelobates cultripes]|uniref:Uncharacterized protein n=1 Tax=Pelobates cultripes TaxID=61616 RepID=A0AAD1T0A0_PELCU|nr:Hypothetical predicted protein [Pelobates cultripes]